MLGLNIGRTELAGLITRKENYASRLLRVALEHDRPPLMQAFGWSDCPVHLPASAQPARAPLQLSPPEAPMENAHAPNGYLGWFRACYCSIVSANLPARKLPSSLPALVQPRPTLFNLVQPCNGFNHPLPASYLIRLNYHPKGCLICPLIHA